MLSSTDKQLLVKLKASDLPDVAEDGKGFFVIWADGRGQVGYKNKSHAIAFIEQGDRDALSAVYRQREKGETVRNIFSPDKSANVHDMLYKEASTRREHHKNVIVNEILFTEADQRLSADPQSFIDPSAKPMARQSGGSNLKNAGTNTSWTPVDPSTDIEQIKNDVRTKSGRYFQSLATGVSMSGDLTPRPLKIKFRYVRSIDPKNDPESLRKATHAMDVLDKYLPGFKTFKDDLTRYKIPLSHFFMPGNHASNSGYVSVQNPEILSNFIQSEAGKPLMLPDGQQVANDSHYKPHLDRIQQGGKIKISSIRQAERILSIENDLDGLDSKQITEAINTRAEEGYVIDEARLKSTLVRMRNEKLQRHKLNPHSASEEELNDIRTIDQIFKHEVLNRMRNWFKEGRADDLPIFLLRQIMRHMKHPTRGFLDRFKFKASTLHSSNGWDDDGPGVPMLAIPPIRQLPMPKIGEEQYPEIRYDRGNGNMGYDHLTDNWENGLGQVVQQWGDQASQWLQALQSGQITEQLKQESPEAYEALKNIMSNRTGAENLLDTLQRFGSDWNSFNSNHVQKSMFKELETVHKLRKMSAGQTQFVPGVPLRQQINQFNGQVRQLATQDRDQASDMLMNLSSDIVNNYYMRGLMGWDNTTLALQALNEPVTAGVRGNGMAPGNKPNRIDENGFEILKQHGYQVAKMMDFLNAVMGRSSYKRVTTRSDGQPENFFNYKYTTSSGTSDGGFITLEVNYDELSAQVSGNEVHVNEQLSFLLGQATGADRDEPIVNRRSRSWKQMLDWVITIYPEVGFELIEMNEHIYDNLQLLETKVKQGINEARNNIRVVYSSSDGKSQVLEGSDLALSEISVGEDTNRAPQESIPEPDIPSDPAGGQVTDNWQPEPTAEEAEQNPVPGMRPETATTPEEDRPMVKSMPDNSLQYLQKRRNDKRRLFRERPASLGSIEERLLKAANKLDIRGEMKVADKIDLLLQRLREVKNV